MGKPPFCWQLSVVLLSQSILATDQPNQSTCLKNLRVVKTNLTTDETISYYKGQSNH